MPGMIYSSHKSLRRRRKSCRATKEKGKDQKVRAGVYSQGPTPTRERQAASARFWLRRVCAIASSRRKHDNPATPFITAIINTVTARRGRRRRRNGDGDERGRSDGSKCGRG